MKKAKIIGWKECVDFPDWEIYGLVAKSDTGAKGSALDVENIEELSDGNIRFDVVMHRKNRDLKQTIIAPLSGHTRVKSSNGHVQERYKVKTQLKIGNTQKEIELSLVSRKGMICRVLLGRTALGADFLLNSHDKYMRGERKRSYVKKAKA